MSEAGRARLKFQTFVKELVSTESVDFLVWNFVNCARACAAGRSQRRDSRNSVPTNLQLGVGISEEGENLEKELQVQVVKRIVDIFEEMFRVELEEQDTTAVQYRRS